MLHLLALIPFVMFGMFVYDMSLATPGTVTTNGSANTENATWSIKPGAASVGLQSMYATGRASALTSISGIVHRLVNFATASTSGTAITPKPKDVRITAAVATVVSGQTLAAGGSNRTNGIVFGHGAAGPGGWVAPNPDSPETLKGGVTSSLDAINVSATASLTFEWSAEMVEF